MAPHINNDPWNYHGIGGGNYTPNGSNIRHQHILDDPIVFNYRGPNMNITINGNNQFGSKGNFWTGLWNGLMGVNNYGMKTGFGIFDLGFMFLANKLMGKGGSPYRTSNFWRNPGLTPNIDTFNRANTYIDPAIRNYTPTPKAEDKKTEDKKTEDKKTENQGKDNKTKGTTDTGNNDGKAKKAGNTGGDDGKKTGKDKGNVLWLAANDKNADGSAQDYAGKFASNTNGNNVENGATLNANVQERKQWHKGTTTNASAQDYKDAVKVGDAKGKNTEKDPTTGAPKFFTMTDYRSGNMYTFAIIGYNESTETLQYKLDTQKSDLSKDDKKINGKNWEFAPGAENLVFDVNVNAQTHEIELTYQGDKVAFNKIAIAK